MTNESLNDLEHVSIEELTTILPLGKTSVYDLIKSGDLVAIKVKGRKTGVLLSSVRAYVSRCRRVGAN